MVNSFSVFLALEEANAVGRKLLTQKNMGENLISDNFRRILLETYLVYALILKKSSAKTFVSTDDILCQNSPGFRYQHPHNCNFSCVGKETYFL